MGYVYLLRVTMTFDIYANWFSPPIVGKTLRKKMFVTVISYTYTLSVS